LQKRHAIDDLRQEPRLDDAGRSPPTLVPMANVTAAFDEVTLALLAFWISTWIAGEIAVPATVLPG
jgi:hypothetical protein